MHLKLHEYSNLKIRMYSIIIYEITIGKCVIRNGTRKGRYHIETRALKCARAHLPQTHYK